MKYGRPALKKLRYFSSVTGLYLLTLLFAALIFRPFSLWRTHAADANIFPLKISRPEPVANVIAGRPVKIAIPALGINLPVINGYYDSAEQSWTLSGYDAQFAVMSDISNNLEGNTFIYGHNNPYVFGSLKKITAGTKAQVITSNNHVFSYVYESTNAVTPNNTSVLDYQGPPILTVQTCSGAWFEQRQMYVFRFAGVS